MEAPVRSLAEYNMPLPHRPEGLVYVHKARQQELDLMADAPALAAAVQRDLALCNPEQRAIFEEITAARSLAPTVAKCYFIYASGGCGKTFLLNLILREHRASGHIAVATAFTGIAAPVEYSTPPPTRARVPHFHKALKVALAFDCDVLSEMTSCYISRMPMMQLLCYICKLFVLHLRQPSLPFHTVG
jgi:hypothetical protein